MVGKWQVVDGMEEVSIKSVGEGLGRSWRRWRVANTARRVAFGLARIGRASSSTSWTLVQTCHGFIGLLLVCRKASTVL
jgi:hypothetical protein